MWLKEYQANNLFKILYPNINKKSIQPKNKD